MARSKAVAVENEKAPKVPSKNEVKGKYTRERLKSLNLTLWFSKPDQILPNRLQYPFSSRLVLCSHYDRRSPLRAYSVLKTLSADFGVLNCI
jgi:hypothetical protein